MEKHHIAEHPGTATMDDTKAERLAAALNAFLRCAPDVEAAAVISYDGLAMASALPPSMDEDRLGAMSAALLSLGEQAASGLGRGDLRQLFVEGDSGFVFLMSAKDQAVLSAVTARTAKIGFMLFEMRRTAALVGDILAEPGTDELVDALLDNGTAAYQAPNGVPLAESSAPGPSWS